MSVYEFPYEGAVDGATVTTGNSGHTGGVSATPPVFHVPGDGYAYIRFGVAAGQTWVNSGFASADQFSYVDVCNLRTGASGAMEVWHARGSGGKQANLLTHTTDLYTFRGAGDATVAGAATTTVPEGVWFVRQIACDRAAGLLRYRVTPLAGGAPLVDYSGAATLGANAYTSIQWGDLGTTPTILMDVGRVRIATGADALDGGALRLLEPYTVAAETPALYLATSPTTSVPAELHYATSPTTSVRVDIA